MYVHELREKINLIKGNSWR